MSARPRAALIHDVTDDHLTMSVNDVVVVVFKRETTMAGVASVSRAYEATFAKHPEGVLLITVVEQGAPLPPAEVRAALARFLEGGAGRTLRSGVVHEGAGFRAAAVRSVVTGLAMLARLPYPHEVFASVDLVSRWFAANSRGLVAADLSAAIGDARATAAAGKSA